MLQLVLVQELRLHLGHVHLRRALVLAALALETQIEHVIQPLTGELVQGQVALQDRRQAPSPGPGREKLVAAGFE